MGVGGLGVAAGLFAGVATAAGATGFGGTGDDADGVSAGDLGSDCTEPESVAFTPPGTAGLSADGFDSPSGGDEGGVLIWSGITARAQTSGVQGFGENVNFYQLGDCGVNELCAVCFARWFRRYIQSSLKMPDLTLTNEFAPHAEDGLHFSSPSIQQAE